MDLRTIEEVQIQKGTVSMVRTGIAVAIPPGWEGQIRARSGLASRGLIVANGPGTIDSDYRGEIKVLLLNSAGLDPFVLAEGERCAQLLLSKVPSVEIIEVSDAEKLGNTERGKGGFGSTGRT